MTAMACTSSSTRPGARSWLLRYQVGGVPGQGPRPIPGCWPQGGALQGSRRPRADHQGRRPHRGAPVGQKGRQAPADLRRYRAARHSRRPEQVDERQGALSVGAPPRPGIFRALLARPGTRLSQSRWPQFCGPSVTVTPIRRKKRLIIEVSALTPRSAERRSHRA